MQNNYINFMRKNIGRTNTNFENNLNYIPYRELIKYQKSKSPNRPNHSNVSFNPMQTQNNYQFRLKLTSKSKQKNNQANRHKIQQKILYTQLSYQKADDQKLSPDKINKQQPSKLIQNPTLLQVQQINKIQHSVSQTTTIQYQDNKIIDNSVDNFNRLPQPEVTEQEKQVPFQSDHNIIEKIQKIQKISLPQPQKQKVQTDEIPKWLEDEQQNQLHQQNKRQLQSQLSRLYNANSNQTSKKSLLMSQSRQQNPEKKEKLKQQSRRILFNNPKPSQNPFSNKPQVNTLKKVTSTQNPFVKQKTQKKLFQKPKLTSNPFMKEKINSGYKDSHPQQQIKNDSKMFISQYQSQLASYENSRHQSKSDLHLQTTPRNTKTKVDNIASPKKSEPIKNTKLLMRFKNKFGATN